MIRHAEAIKVEELDSVRRVAKHFEGWMRDLVITPEWHLSVGKNCQDSCGQVDPLDFPYRSTIIFKKHVWEFVEVAERSKRD